MTIQYILYTEWCSIEQFSKNTGRFLLLFDIDRKKEKKKGQSMKWITINIQ